ncbi:heparinase II/III domain-containing protein [Thalassotalea agariperforans]
MLVTKIKHHLPSVLKQGGPVKKITQITLAAFSLFTVNTVAAEIERPAIWVKKAERAQILEKIDNEVWAKSLFDELKHRVEKQAVKGEKQRGEKLTQSLPLIWQKDKSKAPTLPFFRIENGGTKEQLTQVVKSLQDGVDCGVLYYLTQETKYATCGADILHTFINALQQLEVQKSGGMNSGWMFPKDHLYEARVIGAQLPIIYDFVAPYLKAGGQVYNLASASLTDFDFEAGQNVFKTYVWLALNKGLLDSNWPVLESSSLINNILALDDKKAIEHYLPYYTHIDTKHQASLATVAKHFATEGDIWPESFQYSRHVAGFTVYLMTLLDRYDSSLKLGQKYPNIPGAFTSYYNLQFPNDDYPYIGDGHRTYKIDYADFEMSLLLAKLNGNKQQEETFSNYLTSSIKKGFYDRGHLHNRSYGASPYYTPLQLLWFANKIESTAEVDVTPPRPRTKRLEYAGMNIQRNISQQNPVKNSLMGFVAGGSYIHGHASGMDMELYGQGYVLGIDGGKGTYTTNIHENYYRLFSAHNSVISNGASASKDGWINLGINRVQSEVMEPAAGDAGVSPNHSFSTSSFYDEFNLVAPAQHQRTLALIKLSETKGYYLDIFRAKSDTEQEFHDYVYHNIGDRLEITSHGDSVKLKKDENRYQASAKISWEKHKTYQHPGWHFFDDVKTKAASTQQYEATFTASKLGNKDIAMRALIPAGLNIEITQVKAPKAYGAAEPYNKKPLPTFLLRHHGETWTNPYAVVYESLTEGESYAVQSVERLISDGVFKGVKVKVNVEGKQLTQYILLQENITDIYQDPSTGITFEGQFAVITLDSKQKPTEMYLGSGKHLSYQTYKVQANTGSNSGYLTF